jgi:hypothetical protein
VEGATDWRLTLSARPRAASPTNTWPEIEVSLRGPVNAAKRATDVTAFTSWLAVRAIEQQSKKLDVLEGREPRRRAGPLEHFPQRWTRFFGKCDH